MISGEFSAISLQNLFIKQQRDKQTLIAYLAVNQYVKSKSFP